jgi:hypothetical protein
MRESSARAQADATVEDLIAAVSVYQGELLQAAFEAKMALLLEKLMAAGRWDDVLEWGERWIALGRVPEAGYRAVIVAHGQRGVAWMRSGAR